VGILRRLKIDQPVNVVFGCKPWDQLLFVLVNSSLKIVRDADIKIPRATREYVDIILLHTLPDHVYQLDKAAKTKADSSSRYSSE
jgi:hypothetical protein